eukprot:gene10769-13186_t
MLSQIVDHFNIYPSRTFSQRYCINKRFVQPKVTPPAVFLVLGGEGPLSPEITTRMPFIPVANETNSLVIALELRFYGRSIPFKTLSPDSLAYLNTDQIMEDIAYFQRTITKILSLNGAKWIVMGCSYAGTLAAWYRLKYPHMVNAAIASSAPLRAEVRFTESDIIVRNSLGTQCAHAFKILFDLIETRVFNDSASIKAKFTCEPDLDNKMFLFMLSEALTYSVQYNSRFKIIDNMCPQFIRSIDNPNDLLDMFSFYVKNMFLYQNTTCNDYNLYTFSKSDLDFSGTRQWTWQICSEYGWFVVATDQNSLKSPLINESWWQNEVCKNLFGRVMRPSVERVNMVYGAENIKFLSNVLFTNGDLDPWSSLSVKPEHIMPFSTVVTMPGESHCANWYSESKYDSEPLKNTRLLVNSFLRQFVNPDCDEEDCARRKGVCVAKKVNEKLATSVCVCLEGNCNNPPGYFSDMTTVSGSVHNSSTNHSDPS